jgi:hypothetical protein
MPQLLHHVRAGLAAHCSDPHDTLMHFHKASMYSAGQVCEWHCACIQLLANHSSSSIEAFILHHADVMGASGDNGPTAHSVG